MKKYKNLTIAGLEFDLKFCKKVNDKPLEYWEASKIPLSNVYKSIDSNTYTVNILAYIPTDFKSISNYNQSHIDLLPEEDNKLFFSYNGVSKVKSSINKPDKNNIVLCRNFSIDYDSSEDEPIKYDLYHIKLHYRIIENRGQFVEAIVVYDTNLDPETSRGTVTTSEDTVY